MNYQIVKNEKILKDFIDWLPALQENEMYYVALFARKKYLSSLKSDKAQLKRFTSRKDLLFSKIKQLECELGSYKQDNVEIPNEALGLYISVNPRNVELATKNALKKFADLITNQYNGYNPQSEVLNEIQKSAGKKHFHDFDFDKVDLNETLQEIDKVIPKNCYHVLLTKNGFHIIVDLKQIEISDGGKVWYNTLSKLPGCDVRGDNLIPVPGCSQADFIPSILKS